MAKKRELPSELDTTLAIRVNSDRLEEFKKNSIKKDGRPHTFLLRDVIDAYNEGRLIIQKP